MTRAVLLTLAVALAPLGSAFAQTTAENSMAAPAGVERSIDAVYRVISGPPGKARDWDAMRAMFTPDARLYEITSKGLRGGSVEDYIRESGPSLTSSGFTERELNRRTEIYGDLAHAWSSYEGASADGKIKVRGVNSFQLVRQPDGEWKVFSILWQPEGAELPLPKDLEEGGR